MRVAGLLGGCGCHCILLVHLFRHGNRKVARLLQLSLEFELLKLELAVALGDLLQFKLELVDELGLLLEFPIELLLVVARSGVYT